MKTAILICLLFALVWGKPRVDPLVSTKLGQIRGVRADDGDFTKFLGIPYALVNETDPFGPSLPHPGFEDTFEANDDSNYCAQLTVAGEIGGTLQCLELHIYVPDTDSSEPLPVMVWIHGGGFSQGKASGEYPRTLIGNGVIVVSISYRLGIFGFLCLDTPEVPGNQGFRDQILALRWIKENIESFGGDSSSITLFGQSGGGMSISAHLYSEYEKLFDRAIIQSGPSVSPWFFVPAHTDIPVELAKYFGYDTTDTNDALAYLATIDTLVLTEATYDTGLLSRGSSDGHKIKPCIEKKFDGVQNFINEYPVNVNDAPKIKSTPIMLGFTSEEMGIGFATPPADGNYDNFEYILSFGFNKVEALNGTVELIKHFYVGDEQNLGVNVRKETTDYGDDLVFNHPTQRMAEQLLENDAEAVYRYLFSYVRDKNDTGAVHGSELLFIFDENEFLVTPEKTEEEERLFKQVTKLWSNFAKYGNPTPETSDLLPVEWKPITRDYQYSLRIDRELTLETRPEQERFGFWDLFYKAYGQYQVGYKGTN